MFPQLISRTIPLQLACVLLTAGGAVQAAEPADDAVALLREGKTQEAVALLQKTLAADPKSVRVACLLGETLLDQQRVDESAEVIHKALALAPEAPDLLQAQGDIEFRQGQIPAAEMSYKKALRQNANHAQALFGLGRVFHAASFNKTAAALFRKAHELDPGNAAIVGSFARFAATDAERQAALEKYLSATRGEERRRAQWMVARVALAKFLNGRKTDVLVSPYASTSIHLQTLLNGKHVHGVSLAVAVNDARSATLELDTGASGLTITRRVAERAGVQRIADMDLSGLGDDRDPTGYVGFAEKVRVGDVEFQNCVVHVSDKAFSADSDGLIGTDLFDRFLITLDFRKHQVRLDPLPGPAWDGVEPVDRYSGPEMKGFSQVFRFGHDLLTQTSIGDAQPGFFLLDTGSNENLISDSAAREVTKVRNEDRFRVKGVSGKINNVKMANEVTAVFAGYRQTLREAIALDLSGLSKDTGTEITGILGLPTLILFNLTIDYRDGAVKFVYDPPPGL